ncbi:malto-oligosyltrehalose trehalohydrolase [Pseudanabaena sp. FACHB-2040]|uniref:malto-oligosyltrehalose trehalohydrolase n=1 Tax=Pseudanabaena sp. FACHB-2040 TaxID=2692859 RepID=UPI00168244F2|nr:malto-oligosyltrehalose trehalohydrolase [Pseudanabaena sp. FACHB-2040]MBD2257102.1 malto-oligosyltrehalose trehalohydrolase [Pseudanabaena sp. FACHB-2040]
MRIGAQYQGNHQCEFTVWAPLREQVALQLEGPEPRLIPLKQDIDGYWSATLDDIAPGTLYRYQLDSDLLRPDPASQYQPEDVHGPSQVIDHSAYAWQDTAWSGVPLKDYVIYELHIGTFTPEGTFESAIERLPDLVELGITAVEIMPVAQFPGDRNWGYDGVYPFAVQTSYGGPEGLKKLVDACHQHGLAVILDVVYNHFGPEGNYTRDFGPYFTEHYRTPWGAAINYDDAYSEGVRNFVIENALYWFQEFHFDALRLDAVHAIYDFGAKHVLAQMQETVQAAMQTRAFPAYLIAESDLNDVRVINPPEQGGHNLDAQWSDDFHHCLHVLLTRETQGYYEDFGTCNDMAKVFKDRFVYNWSYSKTRKRYHGSDARHCPPYQFVVCSQNHDQVGNRMMGDRMTALTSFEGLKLLAGAVMLSPYLPMLFMGEEYGEPAPFLYFISHSDPDLIQAVREGRKREFEAFHAEGDAPDAFSRDSFNQSKLNWNLRQEGHHQSLWVLYQTLIRLRRELPALQMPAQGVESLTADCVGDQVILLQRWCDSQKLACLMNFQAEPVVQSVQIEGRWQKRLDSAEVSWKGPGSQAPEVLEVAQELTLSPHSFVLYETAQTAASFA